MGMLEVSAVSGEYARIRDEYHADAWLYGTKTTKEFTDFQKPVLDEGKTDVPEGDFIAGAHESLYYVSIDTLGEIALVLGNLRKSGRPDAHVIEVLTEQTPAAYRGTCAGRAYLISLPGRRSWTAGLPLKSCMSSSGLKPC